jgi:curved DNA-binding protein CbpA
LGHSKDYYQILGIERNATRSEIRLAYLRLAKESHPDHLPHEGDWDRANEQFALVTEAYSTLMDADRRTQYDQSLVGGQRLEPAGDDPQRIQAVNAFRQGVLSLGRGNPSRALLYFEAAVQYDKSKAIYRSYYGLSLARARRQFDRAEEECRKAIGAEIFNPDLYVNLGLVYKLMGDEERALEQFREALNWDSEHSRARSELEAITREKKGGILSRFFQRRTSDERRRERSSRLRG